MIATLTLYVGLLDCKVNFIYSITLIILLLMFQFAKLVTINVSESINLANCKTNTLRYILNI